MNKLDLPLVEAQMWIGSHPTWVVVAVPIIALLVSGCVALLLAEAKERAWSDLNHSNAFDEQAIVRANNSILGHQVLVRTCTGDIIHRWDDEVLDGDRLLSHEEAAEYFASLGE